MQANESQLGSNLAAVTAAILFGASLVAVRAAVRDVPPLTLAFVRFAQGSLLLLGYVLVRARATLRVAPRDVAYLALLGILFYTIFPITFNTSLRYIPASRGALLFASTPLWALLLARLVTREALRGREIVGALATVGGIALVFGRAAITATGPHRTLGDALMLLTAACGAIHNVLVKPMLARYPAPTVTLYAMAIGTVVIAPFAWAIEGPPLPQSHDAPLLWLLLFIGVGAAIAFTLWTLALRRLSPTRAAVYLNLNPTFAVILSALLLHERLTPVFAVGFIAVVAGVFIANQGSPSTAERKS